MIKLKQYTLNKRFLRMIDKILFSGYTYGYYCCDSYWYGSGWAIFLYVFFGSRPNFIFQTLCCNKAYKDYV